MLDVERKNVRQAVYLADRNQPRVVDLFSDSWCQQATPSVVESLAAHGLVAQ